MNNEILESRHMERSIVYQLERMYEKGKEAGILQAILVVQRYQKDKGKVALGELMRRYEIEYGAIDGRCVDVSK